MIRENNILECDFAFKCPRKWSALIVTDNPSIRYCNSCEREVFYAYTRNDLEHHKALGRCIAANIYEPEEFKYTGTCRVGGPQEPRGQLRSRAKPFELAIEELLILGSDDNKK